MTEGTRYTFYPRTYLSKEKKTHTVLGAQEDSGKFFRCWNCGFICNVTRDRLSTSAYACDSIIATAFTDEDGGTLYYPKVIEGCPHCGCKNYKG